MHRLRRPDPDHLLRALLLLALVVSLAAPAQAATLGATSTGTKATRVDLARSALRDAHGNPLDGRGTSIAVIDTGIDPTHPAFRLPGGQSKVVKILSSVPCVVDGGVLTVPEVSNDPICVVPVPLTNVDVGAGGHGSMVGGIAVGDPYALPDGTHVGGVAPGARLVVIATTTALIGIENAFAWVLAHHAAPCGSAVPASTCPPIRVISCSFGEEDPALAPLQAALVKAGVLIVYAAGNTGGDGSTSKSNIDATRDQPPGVLAVAGYDDQGTGTRDGDLNATSSRGAAADPDSWPDISAPSTRMISSCRPYQAICPAIETQPPRSGPGPNDLDTYFIGDGTSFAAPVVDGVIAMLFQVRPQATADQVVDAMKSTAYKFRNKVGYHHLGSYTSSFDKGTGLVDAYAAAVKLGAKSRAVSGPRHLATKAPARLTPTGLAATGSSPTLTQLGIMLLLAGCYRRRKHSAAHCWNL